MNVLHLENIASEPLEFTNLSFVKNSKSRLINIWTDLFLISVAKHFQQQTSRNVLLVVDGRESSNLARAKQNCVLYKTESECSSYQIECFLRKKIDEGLEIGLVVISDFMVLNNGHFPSAIRDFERLSRELGCFFLLRGKFLWHGMRNYNMFKVHKIKRLERVNYALPLQSLNLFQIGYHSVNSGLTNKPITINDQFFHFPDSLKSHLE